MIKRIALLILFSSLRSTAVGDNIDRNAGRHTTMGDWLLTNSTQYRGTQFLAI